MFCYQCEQTAGGKGCTVMGACGKDDTCASLQDLLYYLAQGVSMYAGRAEKLGAPCPDADVFVLQALFSTITNVNFDAARLRQMMVHGQAVRKTARENYQQAAFKLGLQPDNLSGPAIWELPAEPEDWPAAAAGVGLAARRKIFGEDIAALQEIASYGLKGAAAYAEHARLLSPGLPADYAGFHEVLNALAEGLAEVDALLALAMKVGELNLQVMAGLSEAHSRRFGDPQPTPVKITPIPGKAILVSGHDLVDLEALLVQTQGTGIQVYTHGEMLPAHGYPGLKKYPHLAGHYGGAWQEQRREFEAFPGAILMTTNCIQQPKSSYAGRLFSSGLVAWPGVRHLSHENFKPLITSALAAPGFSVSGEEKSILVGFGHKAVIGLADKILAAVQAGHIKHFYLIGGCDGAKPGRNYYTELAQKVPADSVILTLACGKFRFNTLPFGEIDGIPRLLDLGQCNDAYSAILIAQALAEALHTDVNHLPLTIVLSWFEQKAVAVLLTLLHLGIQGITLGPTMPAFVTPIIKEKLGAMFGLKAISTAEADLAAGRAA